MAAAIAGSRLLAGASATRFSRMRPIPLAACCAVTKTSTLPCAPRPRFRSRPANEYLIDFDDALQPLTSGTNHRPAQLVQKISRRAITAPTPAADPGRSPRFSGWSRATALRTTDARANACPRTSPRRHRGLPIAPPAVTQAPRRDPMIRPPTYRAAEPLPCAYLPKSGAEKHTCPAPRSTNGLPES
jgi:hypothetical protein